MVAEKRALEGRSEHLLLNPCSGQCGEYCVSGLASQLKASRQVYNHL